LSILAEYLLYFGNELAKDRVTYTQCDLHLVILALTTSMLENKQSVQ